VVPGPVRRADANAISTEENGRRTGHPYCRRLISPSASTLQWRMRLRWGTGRVANSAPGDPGLRRARRGPAHTVCVPYYFHLRSVLDCVDHLCVQRKSSAAGVAARRPERRNHPDLRPISAFARGEGMSLADAAAGSRCRFRSRIRRAGRRPSPTGCCWSARAAATIRAV
jgi:hypothetical protein